MEVDLSNILVISREHAFALPVKELLFSLVLKNAHLLFR